jgi:hypothetical protein
VLFQALDTEQLCDDRLSVVGLASDWARNLDQRLDLLDTATCGRQG